MKKRLRGQSGFAAVEIVLIMVIVALIAGVSVWIVKQKNKAPGTTPASQSSSGVSQAQQGTTAGIDQITASDATGEQAVDKKYDSSDKTNSTSTDTALNNLGGSYNEANF